MKNKKYLGIISLLLAILMVLSACAPAQTGGDEDAPVTAEGKFSNFIKLADTDDNPLGKVELVSDTLGEILDTHGDYAIFCKESKDKLNNLTETYSLYSVADGKTLLTVSNSYPDEHDYYYAPDYDTRPEKDIVEVSFGTYDDYSNDVEIVYVVVEWETNVAIDEEIVEKDDLATGYDTDTYYDIYDISGEHIATTKQHYFGNTIGFSTSGSYTLLSFGKTVAMYDTDGKLVRTFDGDKEAAPKSFFHSNDKYDYIASPDGIVDESTMSRLILDIYNKEGTLVRSYRTADYADMANFIVLEGRDVIIQYLSYTDNEYCDYWMDGMGTNLDTFLLDVESGKVTELVDFCYYIKDAQTADDFVNNIDIDGIALTDNVRNVANAYNFETDTNCTIFFDNFGTVNFEFDYVINREMDDDDTVIKVLDANHVLVQISSGVAKLAILDKEGDLVAYVPDGAMVLSDYIFTEGGVLYDLDMKRVNDFDMAWLEQYEDYTVRTFGNCIVYDLVDIVTDEDDQPIEKYSVRIFDVDNNSTNTYQNARVYRSGTDDMGGFVLIEKESANGYVYSLVAGDGDVVFTTPTTDYVNLYYCDNALIIELDNDTAYLITEVAMSTEGGDNYEK